MRKGYRCFITLSILALMGLYDDTIVLAKEIEQQNIVNSQSKVVEDVEGLDLGIQHIEYKDLNLKRKESDCNKVDDHEMWLEEESRKLEERRDSGQLLTKRGGVFYYNGYQKETYYNLDMTGVVSIMRDLGYSEEEYEYWVREDGCKMFGDYVMIAANLDIHPRGSIIETSLGPAIVCDTGEFAKENKYQVDIAVDW